MDVDFADFLIVNRNYGKQTRDWSLGNFTDDDMVDFADFLFVAQNFAWELQQRN